MSTGKPLVSFITVNYNTTKDTLEFLLCCEKITYRNIEVIVVDNASKADPGKEIMETFPWVKYIRSEKNLGFAGGNNLGIRAAKGEYLFFLNNDTLLITDFLEKIVEFMQAHPDAGMASPKVLFGNGTTVQYAGTTPINFLGRGNRIGLHEEDRGQYDKNYRTEYGHGAALIVPAKVVKEVGEMPEVFFLYYEEHDWCEMVKRHGYNMYYIGVSSVIHKESMSTGGDESPLKVYYLNRNRLLFMRRNFNGLKLIAGVLYYYSIAFPKNLLTYLVKGKPQLAKAIWRGAIWNLSNPSS
jgi:GT2 family glycosyltransferase